MRILFRIGLALLLTTVTARADSFNFSFVSRNFKVSGVLYGYLLSPGVYQITGLTGTMEPGKEPPLNELNFLSPGEFNNADNLLFTSEPYVDSFGINFFTGQTIIYALIHDQIGYALLACGTAPCSGSNINRIPGTLEVSSTIPEPPSLLLMASGLTLLGIKIRQIASERFA